MRMWMTEPRWMCHHHLLGEHQEIHMFVGVINSGRKVDNYVKWGMLHVPDLWNRHDKLVEEFQRRGWPSGTNHTTPLPSIDPVYTKTIGLMLRQRNICSIKTTLELLRRCPRCRKGFNAFHSPFEAEGLLEQFNLKPVNHKWEGLMLETTVGPKITFSDVL